MSMINEFERHLITAVAQLEDNAYGVSIQDMLEGMTGRYYSIGSIYAALERLEERGFVKSEPGEATPERGGRRKLYFRLAR